MTLDKTIVENDANNSLKPYFFWLHGYKIDGISKFSKMLIKCVVSNSGIDLEEVGDYQHLHLDFSDMADIKFRFLTVFTSYRAFVLIEMKKGNVIELLPASPIQPHYKNGTNHREAKNLAMVISAFRSSERIIALDSNPYLRILDVKQRTALRLDPKDINLHPFEFYEKYTTEYLRKGMITLVLMVIAILIGFKVLGYLLENDLIGLLANSWIC